MNTGRNWTRRSIEELIDDFLKRQKAPTPTQVMPQYVHFVGKTVVSPNFGRPELVFGIDKTDLFTDFKRDVQMCTFLDCEWRSFSVINLEYHCYHTYFLTTNAFSNFNQGFEYVYVMPLDYYPNGFVGTCYKITKSDPDIMTKYPLLTNDLGATVTPMPDGLHNIPSSATMNTNLFVFKIGSNQEYLAPIRALDTLILNSIMTPLGKVTAKVLMCTKELSNAEIQAAYPAITTFQSLTY